MNTLSERLINNSTIGHTSLISESKIFGKKDMITTSVPMVNVALGGRLDGGLTPGLTLFAGPSKHFKSLFALFVASCYLKKYPDAILLFYDSEFGTPSAYFNTFDIDMNRVVYTPIANIEEFKFDISKQLSEITRDDRVIIVVDSVGNLASIKEVEDALEGKSVADMSRAKALKSVFRIVTPHLTIKDIPMIVVNHTYKEIGLFPKDVVGGGTGIYLSADTIWILGRQQEKEGTGAAAKITGYHFIINIEKSRFVREKSKIPITVTYEGGIQKWSGMLDLALEAGILEDGKGIVRFQKKSYKKDAIINDNEFWIMIFQNSELTKYITDKYLLVTKEIGPAFIPEEGIAMDTGDDAVEEAIEETPIQKKIRGSKKKK